jgi:catechol 2,3-dioxygenase-like lactoylglutathione lyase family enzyme
VLDGARFFHVNVNCTDLGRSLAWYTAALGLEASTHTAPPTIQPGDAFGLGPARWDAWILTGSGGMQGGAVDLLEWLEPTPSGAPPATGTQNGFQRIGVNVADLDATLTHVVAAGGAVADSAHDAEAGGQQLRLAHVTDPDGVRVELVENARTGLLFVAVCCADLDRSLEWYRALGFQERARIDSDSVGGAALGLDSPANIREVVLAPAGGGALSLILVGFDHPPVEFAAAREANAVGIARAAMVVDDLDAACAQLDAAGIELVSRPVAMAMGDGLPVLKFVCLRGPDGELLELIESPVPVT